MEDLAFDKMMCERNLADHKFGVFMLGIEKHIEHEPELCFLMVLSYRIVYIYIYTKPDGF